MFYKKTSVIRAARKEYSSRVSAFFISSDCLHQSVIGQVASVCIIFTILLGTLLSAQTYASDLRISLSQFKNKDLSGWEGKNFSGKTDYSFIEDESKGWVLKAYSKKSASGIARKTELDISKTPYLNWSWKVAKLPEVADEKTKKGDDYAARIYVIFKTGPWFWDTKALNYVWSSHYNVGDTWPNAFTSNACMVVVQSGTDKVGSWIEEKHNVKDDIASCFGITVDAIEAVALMSDSDNSEQEALAYYSDIYFSAN